MSNARRGAETALITHDTTLTAFVRLPEGPQQKLMRRSRRDFGANKLHEVTRASSAQNSERGD